MPLGLNKYSMHIDFLMQLLVYKYTSYPCGVMKGQPQSHGQWGVKFKKKRMREELEGKKREVIIGLNKRIKEKYATWLVGWLFQSDSGQKSGKLSVVTYFQSVTRR